MDQSSIEAHFERWRSRGDVAALAHVIDAASPQLHELAARLAPDIALAEDLVQSTLLALIERPRAWDGERPLLPFLVGVLANLAKKQKRAARRSLDPAVLEVREGEPAHASALASEVRDAVRSALASLPEAQRDVVARCVLEGERPIDVARASNRTPGAVRMQLLRGLELLRRALPPGLAGGGALVLAGARGSAAVKESVLARASEIAPASGTCASAAAGASAGASVAGGGLLVASKIGAAVLLVAIAVWLAWPSAEPGSAQAPREATASSAVHAPSGATTSSVNAPPEPRGHRESVAAAPVSPPPTADPRAGWWIVGEVRGLDRAALARADAFVSIDAQAHFRREVRVGADGRYAIDVSSLVGIELGSPGVRRRRPGEVRLAFEHPEYLPCREALSLRSMQRERASDERVEQRFDFVVSRAAIVTGSVRLEPAGSPSDEAPQVTLLAHADGTELFTEVVAQTGVDAAWRFRLRAPRAGRYVVQATHPGRRPAAVEVEPSTEAPLELPTLVLERGDVAIRGTVDLSASVSREQLVVLAHLRERHAADAPRVRVTHGERAAVAEVRGGAALAVQETSVDARGAFELTGIEAGRWELSLGGLPVQTVLAGASTELVDAPSDGVVLGAHVGFVRVRVQRADAPEPACVVSFATRQEHGGLETSCVPADERGLACVAADLRRAVTVHATDGDVSSPPVELAAFARPREQELVLELSAALPTATLAIVPADPGSAPDSIEVVVETQDGDPLEPLTRSAPFIEGRYAFTKLPAARVRVTVRPSSDAGPRSFFGAFVRNQTHEISLGADADNELRVTFEAGGRLRVGARGASGADAYASWTLRDAAGHDVPGRFVLREESENQTLFRPTGSALSLVHESALEDCLAPGRHRLAIESGAWSASPVEFEIRAGEVTRVELELRPR